MDIVTLLLLLVIYLLPTIIRKFKKSKPYTYPDEAKQWPDVDENYDIDYSTPTEKVTAPVKVAKPMIATANDAVVLEAPVQLKLESEPVVPLTPLAYGIVMAEIIGRPRSQCGYGRQQR